jgi:hypothetical protein
MDLLIWGANLPESEGTTRALAYLQASLCEDIPLGQAIAIHAQVVPNLGRHAPDPLWKTIARFIDRYWSEIFRVRRFAFGRPGEVDRALQSLSSRPVGLRAKRVLEVVADDFHVRLSEESRRWCRSDAP